MEYDLLTATNGDKMKVCQKLGVPNGLGGFNRAFVVPSENTTLDVHCFASCVLVRHRHRMTAQEMSVAGRNRVERGVWHLRCGWLSWRQTVLKMDQDGSVGVSDILQSGTLGLFAIDKPVAQGQADPNRVKKSKRSEVAQTPSPSRSVSVANPPYVLSKMSGSPEVGPS